MRVDLPTEAMQEEDGVGPPPFGSGYKSDPSDPTCLPCPPRQTVGDDDGTQAALAAVATTADEVGLTRRRRLEGGERLEGGLREGTGSAGAKRQLKRS
jgi:hypothetical protein